MNDSRVFADFHNADPQGRLRLNCVGTIEDLSRQKIALHEGLRLTFYSEDLVVEGRVQYSGEEALWVAAIDWDAIRSEGSPGPSQETILRPFEIDRASVEP